VAQREGHPPQPKLVRGPGAGCRTGIDQKSVSRRSLNARDRPRPFPNCLTRWCLKSGAPTRDAPPSLEGAHLGGDNEEHPGVASTQALAGRFPKTPKPHEGTAVTWGSNAAPFAEGPSRKEREPTVAGCQGHDESWSGYP
jgi:hypothetical protein